MEADGDPCIAGLMVSRSNEEGIPMNDVKLSIRGLNKRYAPNLPPAIVSLDMDVQEGHLVALLGPSGCGKTTALRIVAGLLDPTAGSIMVDGEEITHQPVHKRGMGMVFQSYALFPHMNVEQNVAFGLQMRNVPKTEQASRVTEALDLVQLGHLAKRNVRALSGGQQQRIALARALVVEPTLLLLDEPLSNLDAKLRETMRTEIRAIQQRTRATTLFVTHDQDEALDMADMVAVMYQGVIEQYGSPVEVYERPRTEFVATFIGQANLLPCTVVREVGGSGEDIEYVVDVPGLGPYGTHGEPGLVGKTTKMVVRPHRMITALGGEIDGDKSVGTITNVSYTGDSISLTIDKAGLTLFSQEPTRHGRIPRKGDKIQVSWRPGDSYLLPLIEDES